MAWNKVLVTGGRDYLNVDAVHATLSFINNEQPIDLIIHGGARGALPPPAAEVGPVGALYSSPTFSPELWANEVVTVYKKDFALRSMILK